MKLVNRIKEQQAKEVDKALFDFDESINELDGVENRYPNQKQIDGGSSQNKEKVKDESQAVKSKIPALF